MSKVGGNEHGLGATATFGTTGMVRRRLYAAAALFALVAANVGACTDEFDSCKETRTCRPEAMGGGAAGSPLSDGGETGTGEAGGAQLAGEGGASSLAEFFRVVSTVPESDATGVERDKSIHVTFSAPVDPDTVSDDSFRLMGPEGPVVGKLEVSGAEVVLTPATALALYADYELELSADLATTDGDVLQEGQSFGFRTRDGAWGQPKRLTSAKANNVAAEGARSGHVVVHWIEGQSPSSKIVTFFDPGSVTWSAPGPIETSDDNNYGFGCVALNEEGEAFSLLGIDSQAVWNRATKGAWGMAKPTPAAQQGSCALADDGTAIAIWETFAGNDGTVFAASLSSQDVWSNPTPLRSMARSNGVIRYGAGFLAVQRLDGGGTVATEYDPEVGWLPSKPMVEPGVDATYWSLAALKPAALMTWNGPGERVHVSSFDGQSWTSQELGPGAYGTTASISSTGRLAGWENQGFAYVVRGDVDGSWQDPVKLGVASANGSGDYGPAATIDSSGNALAALPNGSVIAWRRSLQSSNDWSEIEEIPDQDPSLVLSRVDSGGNVMLIWQNPLGVWASRFE
jgi:hypothetical protein